MAILKSKPARAGHAAGIFSDMTLDGPEIGTLVAVVDRAKNLPNRKTIGKQDPYCAMRLGKEAKKTDTDRRGGQTPKWDQELRFVVHDSPDYYKLKCSIFNDDKKTDLIGESWLDLTNVIKLGGGQNDLWHQLTFKGKYAGDIRVELTFYDSREKPLEKKKLRERQDTSPCDSTSDLSLSGPRSLGPREIKRRPLPTNPAGPTPPQSRSIIIENANPEILPNLPIEDLPRQRDLPQQSHPLAIHAPVPTRPRGSSASPQPQSLPEPESQYHSQTQSQFYEQSEHFSPQDHNQQAYYQHRQPTEASHDEYSAPHRTEQRQLPWHGENGSQHQHDKQQYHTRHNANTQYEQSPYDYLTDQTSRHTPHSAYPDEDEIWQHQRPQSIHTHSAPISPYDTPTHRPLPSSANSDGQIVRFQQQQRAEPPFSRPIHADSPLRQSISHQETHLPLAAQSSAPPPLPPKHRDTTPRRSRNEYPPSAYMSQPTRTADNRLAFSERGPLQSFEDDHNMYKQERFASPQTSQRHSMYEPNHDQRYEPPQQYEQHGQQIQPHDRRRTYDKPSGSLDPRFPRQTQRSFDHSPRDSYEVRDTSYNYEVMDEPHAMTPQDGYHSGHEDGYQPFVEDAPPSPGLQPAVARKAVGAQPKKLTGLPFGPDAYDVLNPASSPVSNVNTRYQTPAQIKEAERLKEVEKIRELGPIIGNDGRVIDPSDHLPSDTWAPEPERKNRKPEHVIHIRTKNDPKRPSGARISPLVVKNNAQQSAYGNPAPEPAISPAVHTPPGNFVSGRNRLQKTMPTPTRPPPNQPYISPARPAASSPALASSPHDVYQDRQPSRERRPSYDNRSPSHLVRPALSEYQVPAGNSYTPRSKSYERDTQQAVEPAHVTPSKQPSYQAYPTPAATYERRDSYDNRGPSHDRRNEYPHNNGYSRDISPAQPQQTRHYDDPLAAEMSMIDIGPSRHGQSPGYQQGAMVRSRGRW